MSLNKRTVKDTYEAAFYMIHGAIIESVSISRLAENDKRRFRRQRHLWILELDNVPYDAIKLWKTDQAFANVRDIERERNRIKRRVRKLLFSKN